MSDERVFTVSPALDAEPGAEVEPESTAVRGHVQEEGSRPVVVPHKPVRPVLYPDRRFHGELTEEQCEAWNAEDAGALEECVVCGEERPLTWFCFSPKEIRKAVADGGGDEALRIRVRKCEACSHPEGPLDTTRLTQAQAAVMKETLTVGLASNGEGAEEAGDILQKNMPALMKLAIRLALAGNDKKLLESLIQMGTPRKQVTTTKSGTTLEDLVLADLGLDEGEEQAESA